MYICIEHSCNIERGTQTASTIHKHTLEGTNFNFLIQLLDLQDILSILPFRVSWGFTFAVVERHRAHVCLFWELIFHLVKFAASTLQIHYRYLSLTVAAMLLDLVPVYEAGHMKVLAAVGQGLNAGWLLADKTNMPRSFG